jgi:hypothetical protein
MFKAKDPAKITTSNGNQLSKRSDINNIFNEALHQSFQCPS